MKRTVYLAWVPMVALTACDDAPDRHKPKIATPPAVVQSANGAYKKCANGEQIPADKVCYNNSSSGSGSGGYGGAGSAYANDADAKRGGFGKSGSSGKSGG